LFANPTNDVDSAGAECGQMLLAARWSSH